MRKLNKAIAAVTTLAIAASMAAPAFAASPITTTGDSPSHLITATYALPTPTYHVEVTWGNMEFTYQAGTWDTTTLTYRKAGWRSSTNTVTVTNKSDAEVTVGFTAEITKDTGNISAYFTTQIADLDSAAKDIYGTNTTGSPTSVSSTLTLGGRPSEALSGVIGKATVAIE